MSCCTPLPFEYINRLAEQPEGWTIALQVEDIHAVFLMTPETMAWGGPKPQFKDQDGNVLALLG